MTEVHIFLSTREREDFPWERAHFVKTVQLYDLGEELKTMRKEKPDFFDYTRKGRTNYCIKVSVGG